MLPRLSTKVTCVCKRVVGDAGAQVFGAHAQLHGVAGLWRRAASTAQRISSPPPSFTLAPPASGFQHHRLQEVHARAADETGHEQVLHGCS